MEKITVFHEDENIEYTLISEIITDEENNLHTAYGVRVQQTKPDNKVPEVEEIHDLTFDKGHMIAFIEKMARNKAGLAILAELAEDFLAEEYVVRV